MGLLLAAVAALLAACGEDSAGPTEARGNFQLRVADASFPAEQQLGETSLLRLAIRNEGERAVPALVVTIGIAGERGRTSQLPFAIHDPQPELARPERPVWVLAATYPRLAGSGRTAGAATSNAKTFAFGPLEPGETVRPVWKLSAVRAGEYTLRYEIGAGLGGGANAETSDGDTPGGSITTEITAELPETEVKDNGEVVEIGGGP